MNRFKDDITAQLLRAGNDPAVRARVLEQLYAELVKIARAELARHQRGNTLNTRALVNEAYLKLFGAGELDYDNRKHFFATAARAMRQVVISYARNRLADCRGAGAEHVGLDELEAHALPVDAQAERWLAIDAAMTKLASLDPRLAEIIELRFFAGMEVEQLAEVMNLSVPTIVRDTRTARAFLQAELESGF